MQLHNIILYVTIVSIALLSFVTLSRVYKLESSDEFSSKSKSDEFGNNTTTGGRRRLTETTTASNNPFMDSVCLDFIQDSTLEISIPTVSVVIVARNEERSALLATVKSVYDNSVSDGNPVGVSGEIELKHIIIVDDFSYSPIQEWEEWSVLKSQKSSLSSLLTIKRLNHHSGTTYAKNYGTDMITKTITHPDKHMIVFLDSYAVVSPYWLVPLISTLTRYPQSIVYPTIDILTSNTNSDNGEKEVGIIQGDNNMVLGFNWNLLPKWEDITTSRVKLTSPIEKGRVEYISPSVPSTFAVRLSYFSELGKFDESLYNTYTNPLENTELALRVWLCGGSIIKQVCSRVALYTPQLFKDTAISDSTTQGIIDHTILNIGQKWLSAKIPNIPFHSTQQLLQQVPENNDLTYQEVAFRARFYKRIPYYIELSKDPILTSPAQSTLYSSTTSSSSSGSSKKNKLYNCYSFQWYINTIYPGLLLDIPTILTNYNTYIHSDYISQQDTINSLLNQYNKPIEKESGFLIQTGLINSRNKKIKDNGAISIGAGVAIQSNKNFMIKRQFLEPPGPKKPTKAEELTEHSRLIESELICIDFPEKVYSQSCEYKLQSDPELCTVRKAEILFQCPKTCGYCDKTDGRFCEDFYLNKCPLWQSQGRCEERDAERGLIKDICRKSCGICTPIYAGNGDSSVRDTGNSIQNKPSIVAAPAAAVDHTTTTTTADKQAKPQEGIVLTVKKPTHKLQQSTDPNLPPPPKLPEFSEKEVEMLKVDVMINKPMSVDPEYLQAQYAAGMVPDTIDATGNVISSNTVCNPMDHGDAQLLSRIHLPTVSDKDLHLDSAGKPLRIFCGIYTMEGNHNTNVKATRNTWAKKCDGFIAFSTVDDASIPAVAILHEGKEAYDNMWQKSRSIWKYIYTHLRDKYDFFLLGGDDMFYIIENLRLYLGSVEITTLREEREGLYIGRIFQPPNQIVFNSGGAGYMLDTKALTVLGKNIDSPKCFPHQTGFWEDVNVANCLKKSTPSILPYDTRDALQRERFHPFTPGLQLSYRIPPNTPDWYAKYNPDLKVGFECCSDESISFHYIKEKLMYRLYNYVYHCDNKIV